MGTVTEDKVRVVLVDDEPDVVRLERDLLEIDGRFEVVGEAADGIEAVFVNGTRIVDGDTFTGATPGTLLASGRDTETVSVPG